MKITTRELRILQDSLLQLPPKHPCRKALTVFISGITGSRTNYNPTSVTTNAVAAALRDAMTCRKNEELQLIGKILSYGEGS